MKKNSLFLVLFSVLFSWVGALPGPVLAMVIDIPTIDADMLKYELYHGAPMVLANALSPIEFKDLTIRGSVNIPSSKVEGNPNLPEDKSTLLVFFCKGPG
ncbi:MAG TPA: hypothetical protein ENJ30_04085 [Desulfobulbaceae bacterium]|nr:hypothetical protein [Desulfobulbaceae bacterium]